MGWRKVPNMPGYFFFKAGMDGPSSPPPDAKYFRYDLASGTWTDQDGILVNNHGGALRQDLDAYTRNSGGTPTYQNTLYQSPLIEAQGTGSGYGTVQLTTGPQWDVTYDPLLQPLRAARFLRVHGGEVYQTIRDPEDMVHNKEGLIGKRMVADGTAKAARALLSHFTMGITAAVENTTVAGLLGHRASFLEKLIQCSEAGEEDFQARFEQADRRGRTGLLQEKGQNTTVRAHLKSLKSLVIQAAANKMASSVPYLSYAITADSLVSGAAKEALELLKECAKLAVAGNRIAQTLFGQMLALDSRELESCLENHDKYLSDLLLGNSP